MDYNDLRILMNQKRLVLKNVCQQMGITSNGFKKAIERQTLPEKNIRILCGLLDISPNEFFVWDDPSANVGVYASNISGVNTQNSNEAILALEKELKEQHGIIKEKDKQINKLLAIIEKGKKS